MKAPDELDRWLQQQQLAVVPVAAKELLDGAIDLRLERDRLAHQLIEITSRESDTPVGDLLRLREHQADVLVEVHEAATDLISHLRRGMPSDDEYRTWRQAVGRYDRRTA